MGGGACVIIINGEDALAALSQIPQTADTAYLAAGIEASCELVTYRSLYLQNEDKEIPDSATAPIISFHKNIQHHIAAMTLDGIKQAGKHIHQLNEILKDAEQAESS